MAQQAQIRCINKTNRFNPHERISHIGGFVTSHWKLTLDDAISKIERGEWQFYVDVGGKGVWIVVAVHNGRKYLKTQADGQQPNNLLSLPECP
jgi:Protein of unknown function (DUF3892)